MWQHRGDVLGTETEQLAVAEPLVVGGIHLVSFKSSLNLLLEMSGPLAMTEVDRVCDCHTLVFVPEHAHDCGPEVVTISSHELRDGYDVSRCLEEEPPYVGEGNLCSIVNCIDLTAIL